ncbi:MAG: phosphoribosyltransferase [Patescibacteria group bacterium]
MQLKDRLQAGDLLAQKLVKYKNQDNVLLFALPRGGVPVAARVAAALELPLDIIVTRKIGAPFDPEFALGAMAETGEIIWNDQDLSNDPQVNKVILKEKAEAKRRVALYRNNRPLPDMKRKTAIIIDDGLATGATMRAAVAAAKHQHADKIAVAVPHGAKQSLDLLRRQADQVIALFEPGFYGSVGQYYQIFSQTSDDEVLSIMKQYGIKQ